MSVKVRLIKGKWRIVIDWDGLRQTVTIGAGDRAKAKAEVKARDIEARLNAIGVEALKGLGKKKKEAPVPFFGHYAASFLAHIEKTRKPSTYRRYESIVRVHLSDDLDGLRLDEIDRQGVKAFVDGKLKAECSYHLIDSTLVLLRMILNEAVEDGLIKSHPVKQTQKLLGPAPRIARPEPFSDRDFEKLLGHFKRKHPRWYEFVMLLHRTGMRIGEALALEWRDVDFEQGQIWVHQNFPVTLSKKELGTTKSNERFVDMSPQLAMALKDLQRRKRKEYFGKSEPEPKWVFSNNRGRPMYYSRFRTIFSSVQEQLKIRYRKPHNLRHTFASKLLAEGQPITYVANQLGDTVQTMLRRYAHWIPSERMKGVAVLDSTGDK